MCKKKDWGRIFQIGDVGSIDFFKMKRLIQYSIGKEEKDE